MSFAIYPATSTTLFLADCGSWVAVSIGVPVNKFYLAGNAIPWAKGFWLRCEGSQGVFRAVVATEYRHPGDSDEQKK